MGAPAATAAASGFICEISGINVAAAPTPQGGAIWIDEGVFKAREGALLGKATDGLVGRNDVPIAAALGAPAQQSAPQIEQQVYKEPSPAFGGQPTQQITQQPANAAFGQMTTAAPVQQEQPAPARRRRTAAQIAADNAAEAGPSPAPQNAPFAPQSAAPFAANPAPAAAGGFGMLPGAAPDPGLASTLTSLFGNS